MGKCAVVAWFEVLTQHVCGMVEKKTVKTSIRIVLHLTEIRKGRLPSISEALLLQPTRQTSCY